MAREVPVEATARILVDIKNVKPRRLSLFNSPDVDPTLFVPRKRRSSVYQANHSRSTAVTQMRRFTSTVRLQDWDRYGWHQTMERVRPRNKSIFITRSKTYAEEEREPSLLCLPEAESKPVVTYSLPVLPTNGLGDPMLRRPTVTEAKPVSEDGDLFIMLNKGKELKPFSFMGDDTKAIEFYKTHYPLLLGKLSENTESQPSAQKGLTEKQVRERLRCSTAERRLLKLRQRMKNMEGQLLDLERHPDGDGMVTELRDLAFNPMLWTWNLKRYRLTNDAP